MSQHCRPEQRARTREICDNLEHDDRVLCATPLPPSDDANNYDAWLADVVLQEDCLGMPSDLLCNLIHSVTVHHISMQGAKWACHLLVV